MKWKGKEHVEKKVNPMKIVKKKPTFKAKKVQKMLQWIKMDLEEY
jgi:hypothetical protein